MKSFFFLSLRDDMGKKGKGAESGRRTQEHRRTRARARVRETRNNVVDTLASFSGVALRHRIGESESRMLGWAQRARRGRNNTTRYHVFSFFDIDIHCDICIVCTICHVIENEGLRNLTKNLSLHLI